MWSRCVVLASLLILSCGGAETPSAEPRSAVVEPLSLSLTAGDRFDVLHLERVQLDGREVFARRTRFALEVGERTVDGGYVIRGSLARERIGDSTISVSTPLHFEWLANGHIRAAPRAECVLEGGAVEVARFVQFTLGGAPLEAVDGQARVEAWVGEALLGTPESPGGSLSGEDQPCQGSAQPIQRTITRAIAAGRSQIQACYERRLRIVPTLAGRMDLAVRVTSPGHVTFAGAPSTSFDSELVGCVRDVLVRMDAGPGPIAGELSFTLPFVFAPQP